MKTPIIALALAFGLSGCGGIIAAYDDEHLESPTNTITVPPQGYVQGARTVTGRIPGDRATVTAEYVEFTTDGLPGYVVCQHFWTAGNKKRKTPGLVIYDKGVVLSSNMVHRYAKPLCMEEGLAIERGQEPEGAEITAAYQSNPRSATLSGTGD